MPKHLPLVFPFRCQRTQIICVYQSLVGLFVMPLTKAYQIIIIEQPVFIITQLRYVMYFQVVTIEIPLISAHLAEKLRCRSDL